MGIFQRAQEEPLQDMSSSDPSAPKSDGVASADPTIDKAKETIADFREGKRGRPKKSKESKPDPLSEAQAKIQVELNRLYSPENWKAIVRAPADLRLALTGREHWNLSDREVQTLAETASTAAQYWLVADPKYLALTLLMFNIATIYGARIALDVAQSRRDKRSKKEKIDDDAA
jgi:hypothetical protein